MVFPFYVLSGTTDVEAPVMSLSVFSVNEVTVNISTVSGATTYEYRRSTDSGSTWIGGGEGWVSASAGNNTDSGDGGGGLPTDGQQLYYEARAIGLTGAGDTDSGFITMPTLLAPTNFTLTPDGSAAEFTVNWTEPGPSQGISPSSYTISYADNASFTNDTQEPDPAPPETFTEAQDGILFETTYYGRVRSTYSGAGSEVSDWSNTDSGTTPSSELEAPTNLQLSLADIDAVSINLTEANDPSVDDTEYRVSIDNGATWLIDWTSTGGVYPFTESNGTGASAGLAQDGGGGNIVKVQARSVQTGGDPSNAIEQTITIPTFGDVTGLTDNSTGQETGSEIVIGFTDPADSLTFSHDGIRVERDLSFLENYDGASPYTDDAVSPGESYDYDIFSRWDSTITGREYTSANAAEITITAPLQQFTISVVDNADGDSVDVTVLTNGWPGNAAETITEYNLFYRVNLSMNGDVTSGTAATGNPYTAAQAEAGVTLSGFSTNDVVYAIFQAESGEPGDSAVFAQSEEGNATVSIAAPSAPSITAEEFNSSASPNYIGIECTTPSGTTSFEYQGRSGNNPGQLNSATYVEILDPLGDPNNGCMVTETDPTTEGSISTSRLYQIRVRACNAGGCSAWVESGTIENEMFGTVGCDPGTGI